MPLLWLALQFFAHANRKVATAGSHVQRTAHWTDSAHALVGPGALCSVMARRAAFAFLARSWRKQTVFVEFRAVCFARYTGRTVQPAVVVATGREVMPAMLLAHVEARFALAGRAARACWAGQIGTTLVFELPERTPGAGLARACTRDATIAAVVLDGKVVPVRVSPRRA